MPAERLALRHSCNALNAYSPSTALYSAFTSLWSSERTIEWNYHSAGSPRVHRNRRKLQQQSVTHFSTKSLLKQESLQAPPSVQTVLHQDSKRLHGGGTYENYELLKNTLGEPDAVERSTKSGTNAVGHDVRTQFTSLSRPSRETRVQKPPSQRPSVRENGGDWETQHVFRRTNSRPKSEAQELASPEQPYSFQIHMKQIAKDAGSLAKIKVKLSDTETINARKKRLNYRGRYIDMPKSPFDQSMPIPWALELAESSGKDASELLELEIARFVKHMECTPIEKVAREAVVSELKAFVAEHAGSEVTSELFGSERTGLALSTSDIDIRLDCDSRSEDEKWQFLMERLKDVTMAMYDSDKYTLVVARLGTQYPILNAQHKKTGIHLQIVAAPSSAAQDAVTVQYMKEQPHLRTLYILFRAALGSRGLVDVFNGGTGSYGLFIMIAAAIKRRSSDPPTSLTGQLFRFLDFCHDLDKSKYGISVSPPKLFKKHDPWEVPVKDFVEAARRRGDLIRSAQWAISQRRLYQPYLLCLQDPANPFNDLGRKSNAIKHTQTTLAGIHGNLVRDMKSAAAAAARGQNWAQKSILMRVVGPCHELNYERRKKVEEYGLEVMASRKGAIKDAEGLEKQVRERLEAVA